MAPAFDGRFFPRLKKGYIFFVLSTYLVSNMTIGIIYICIYLTIYDTIKFEVNRYFVTKIVVE